MSRYLESAPRFEEVWREALGLEAGEPYAVSQLDHQKIDPWQMVEG